MASDARAERLILAACILGSSIALVDGTATNVALPTIARELGGGLAGQQWVSGAYLLTLGSLILIGGSLGDVLGPRRVFEVGVAGFALTSLLCALAPTIELLVAGRALQGMAGALLTPSALAVIVAAFPAERRGPAIGSWTAWGGVATIVGPLLGGELLAIASWRWIFIINLPLAAACLFLVAKSVPASLGGGGQRHIDYRGATLAALGLAGPVFALIEQPQLGWSSPAVFGPLIGGVALFGAFLAYERRARDPMLPLVLFRRSNFSAGNAVTLLMYAGLAVLFLLLVLYLQQVAGFSTLKAGTVTLPVTVLMITLSRRFGALADRHGPRFFMSVGPLVSAVGLAWLLRLHTHVDYLTDLMPALLLFALGLSMTVAPLTAAVLAGVEASEAGIASAVNNAVARTAGLLATAAIGAIVSAQFSTGLHSRLDVAPLGAAARAAETRALRQPLGVPDGRGLPARERAALRAAAGDASESAFHVGVGIAVALLALAGGLAAIGIRNPRRVVLAEECPGGTLAGAPRDPALLGGPVPVPAEA